MVSIPTALEEYFGASPIGPLFEVGRIEVDRDHPLNSEMRLAFGSVSEEEIREAQADRHFEGLHGDLPHEKREWFAREWVVIRELNRRICDKRAGLLTAENGDGRPPPYGMPAVEDLELCEDNLVPLAAFDIEDGVLVRGGHAFTVLPPTPGVNSSYWLTRALGAEEVGRVARVRLDPLLHGPSDTFPRMSYRMLWYGPPLKWDDVRTIDKEAFGRWHPSSLSHGEFTDYHWSPRRGEVHLAVEEVPEPDHEWCVPSRYFHAIFSKARDAVIHLDGACRFFTTEERARRGQLHLRQTGKLGTRVKVFRIDGEIEVGPVAPLGGTFFVWNYDVADFFGADVPPSLLGDIS